jgi:glycosyltransferase involved in cell wall biosynthesis
MSILSTSSPGRSHLGNPVRPPKPLKIAFVNQPFDTILPPFQSSVGTCTYGVLPYLEKYGEIVVYGLQDANRDRSTDGFGPNVSFRFLPSTQADRLANLLRTKSSRLIQFSSPMSTSSRTFPAFGRQVAMDLQKQQCDVIHIQHASQYVPIIRELNPNAKIVLHMHAEWFSQSGFDVLADRLRGVDLLTCVSNHVAEKTKRDFPSIADRCETTYNGIEPKLEFNREKDYVAARRRKEKHILFAGGVSPHKGPHVLLDAFNIVARSFPDARLDFLGGLSNYPLEESFELSDRQQIKAVAPFYAKNRIARLKASLKLAAPDAGTYQSYLKAKLPPEVAAKVTFHGHVGVRQNLIERYYDADVLAFPSIWDEGFPLPALEAMAAGLPVVGTRPGVAETIEDQRSGILVDKNDAKGMAEALLRVLQDDDLRDEMGRAARRRVLEHFTWEKVAERMHTRYAALCQVSTFEPST